MKPWISDDDELGWIPCSERMPPERPEYPSTKYDVTVTSKSCGRYIERLEYFNGHWYGNAFTMPKRRVVAWRENPKPYAGKSRSKRIQKTIRKGNMERKKYGIDCDEIKRYIADANIKYLSKDDVGEYVSAFGSTVFRLTDSDIEHIKNGGVLTDSNADEYGILILYTRGKQVVTHVTNE